MARLNCYEKYSYSRTYLGRWMPKKALFMGFYATGWLTGVLRYLAGMAGLCGAVLTAWLPLDSAAQPLPQPRRAIQFSDYLGMNTPLLFYTPAVYQHQLAMLKALGLRWVRVDLHWDVMEPTAGAWRYDLLDPLMRTLQQGGFQPVVYLVGTAPFAATVPAGTPFRDQYPPRDNVEYAARITALAQRYPFVKHWQVWNEPNILPFWRPQEDPDAYGRMLQATARSMVDARLADRQIVTAGMAYYSQMPLRGNALMLEALYASGALQSAKVVAYHPYSDLPEGDPTPADPDNFIHRARILNQRLRSAGVAQIWATEWGWSTYQGEKDFQTQITEAQQADYLLRRLMLMMALDFDRVFWFSFADIDKIVSERDRHYGLVRPDGSPKPAWHALQRFLALTGDRLEPLPPVLPTEGQPAFYQHSWQRADGRHVTLFYGQQSGGTLAWVHSRPVQLHWPATGGSQTLTPHNGRITVPIQATLGVLVY